jgi:hypothetical protein
MYEGVKFIKKINNRSRAIDPWSVHGCVGFPIPVSG